jgi:hypothetical protein
MSKMNFAGLVGLAVALLLVVGREAEAGVVESLDEGDPSIDYCFMQGF